MEAPYKFMIDVIVPEEPIIILLISRFIPGIILHYKIGLKLHQNAGNEWQLKDDN